MQKFADSRQTLVSLKAYRIEFIDPWHGRPGAHNRRWGIPKREKPV